jgi:hypothetical protein
MTTVKFLLKLSAILFVAAWLIPELILTILYID